MGLLLFILKTYCVVLLVRYILTQQELTFNPIGRAIATLTDPIFKKLGKSKATTDKYIFLLIIGLIVLFGVFTGLQKGDLLFGLFFVFNEFISFFAIFFIVCILLGLMASPYNTNAFPQFFYRLGNIWVSPAKKVLPLKGNSAAASAIFIVFLLYLGLSMALSAAFSLRMGTEIVPISIAKEALVSFGLLLTEILGYYVFVLIARAILSWVSPDPRNSLVQLLYYMTEPLLYRFRKIVPQIGGIDLSTIAAIICVQFLIYVLQNILWKI